jgi:hypothetical protein
MFKELMKTIILEWKFEKLIFVRHVIRHARAIEDGLNNTNWYISKHFWMQTSVSPMITE